MRKNLYKKELNYILLDDQRLKSDSDKENIIGISIPNNSVDGAESFLRTFRHKNGQVFASRLSSLIDEEQRSEGRKRKNNELKAQMKAKDGSIDNQQNIIGRPSSG